MSSIQQNSDNKPSKTVAYIFMGIIFLGLVYFVYNWWKCRQSRVLEDEVEMNGYDFDEEDEKEKEDDKDSKTNFRKAPRYGEQA